MNMSESQTLIVIVCLVFIVIVAAAYVGYRRRESRRLEARFGPEYGRAVEDLGSRAKAEAELAGRERRVQKLAIVPLSAADAERFMQAWKALQARFIDNPKGVLVEADQLVRELMLKRGYPMGDFERRAADISVDHPQVVENYRAAQAIAVRDQRGVANTEDLRRGVIHFRTLFQELLDTRGEIPVAVEPVPIRRAA